MEFHEDQFLWVERYRPRKLDDCILPNEQKNIFKKMLEEHQLQNMLFCGGAGVGKTTVARALCEELGIDYIIINGSEESGIDVLRTKIKQFASTVSFNGGLKVVILDEADYLNPNSTQPALRGFIEEFSKNCRFVFTCNYKNRIIQPLHSRCSVIEFKIAKEEKPKIANRFFKRITEILNNENITFDPKVVAKLVEKYFPDYRRTLNELQRYSVSGSIDEGLLTSIADVNMNQLLEALKEKDWKKMRTWVVNNLDNDPTTLFRKIYDTLTTNTQQIPQLVLIIADYQYKSAFVADQEINLAACLTEIMASVELK
ncbi:AAA family ATPase [bacterium]|nr:AAA family ATPase [bacterium]